MSSNVSGAVVGSVESVQCQRSPCSSLYLFSMSTVAPQMHSLSLTSGFYPIELATSGVAAPSFLCLGSPPLLASLSSMSDFHPDRRGMKVATYLFSFAQLWC